ncbi:MAG: AzlD domain-containing protein [Burkholderiaceae bacterium]
MSAVDVWITIALLTLSTLLTRCSLFLFGHAVRFPPRVQHALRYAPAAALAAIVIPDLWLADGATAFSWANPKLWAGIGATLFFLGTRHLLATIVVGMVLFSALRLTL